MTRPAGGLHAAGPHPSRESTGDPFPREGFVALVARLPRYLRLAWGLAGEPRLSRTRRAGLLAAAAYLASPIDAIPGVIPVLGQLDDMAVSLLALRAALRALDPATRERQLAAAGLAPDDLDGDLHTVATTAGWLVRRGVAVGRRLALLAASASLAAGRGGVHAVRRGVPVMARSGSSAARMAGRSLARAGGHGRDAVARRLRRTAEIAAKAGADPAAAPGAEVGPDSA